MQKLKKKAKWLEPSKQAEKDWSEKVSKNAKDIYQFQMECTPGYYNNEGMPSPMSLLYNDGAPAFHELLRKWREEGGMDDVLVF